MATLKIERKEKNDWTIEGDIMFPSGGKVAVTNEIIPGIYKVVPATNPMDTRLGIKRIANKFTLDLKKIYPTGGEEIMKVIKNTWNNELFQSKNKNLCAIFLGIKGTGKTISTKILCNDFVDRYPVIIIDNSFDGKIVNFVQELDFKCVLLIDEAEKIFTSDDNSSVDLLRICDGVYKDSSKIVLMTMNELRVDPNLISRPGRVRYIQEFSNLPEKTCRDIINDNLTDKSLGDDLYEIIKTLENVTIDIIQSMIEEVNIYGHLNTVKNFMNISKTDRQTDLFLFKRMNEEDVKLLIEVLRESDCKSLNELWYIRGESINIMGRYKRHSKLKEFLQKKDADSLYEYFNNENVSQFYHTNLSVEKKGDHLFGIGTLVTDKDEFNVCKIKLDMSDTLDSFTVKDEEDLNNLKWERRGIISAGKKVGDEVYAYVKNHIPMSYYRYTSVSPF